MEMVDCVEEEALPIDTLQGVLSYLSAALAKASNKSEEKEASEGVCLVFRAVGEAVLDELVEHILSAREESADTKYYVLGLLLQFTNKYNYTILSYLVEHPIEEAGTR